MVEAIVLVLKPERKRVSMGPVEVITSIQRRRRGPRVYMDGKWQLHPELAEALELQGMDPRELSEG